MANPTNGDDILVGTAGDDVINGLAGNDKIDGLAGNDTLDGGTGADELTGGAGNDTYLVDDVGDRLIETSATGGTDRVKSSISFTLGANIENLALLGAAAINATGNSLANILLGNGGANILDGKAGADSMNGGAGNDTYVVDNAGDIVIENGATGGTDLVKSAVSFILGNNVENLALSGLAAINATGNGLANTLTGNGAANILDGKAGADAMNGGAGNDTYIVDNAGDTVIENGATGGTDLVKSSVSFTLGNNVENLALAGAAAINATGNSLANALTGNAAANILDGKAGADTMNGGAGNDTYVVDNAGDIVIENGATGGTDLVKSAVSFTLGANVENLALSGSAAVNATGNSLANTLTGNGGANILDGKAGADTMNGGAGNDTYVVDNVGDRVIENGATGGTDLVKSAVSFTLGANVENLALSGSAAVNATGNALANQLTGNGAANSLDGGDGADRLRGGLGGDTLTGGAGGDLFVYGSAAESTSVNYDTIVGFDYREDRVDLPGTVTGFAGELEGGRLDTATFDADLAAAIGALLPPNQCGSFLPDSGNLAGQEFFVVDANGEAGYQAGEDFVFRLIAPVEVNPVPIDIFV